MPSHQTYNIVTFNKKFPSIKLLHYKATRA